MKVDESLIKHVADVARLNLSDKEIKEFMPQLKEILNNFEKIQKVNTEKISPSYHAVEIKNRVRDDTPGKVLDNDTALKNTQHKKDGYFKGPKIM